MIEEEKIKTLGYAIIILSRRLLKLESSEKYRDYLRQIIADIGIDICKIKEDK